MISKCGVRVAGWGLVLLGISCGGRASPASETGPIGVGETSVGGSAETSVDPSPSISSGGKPVAEPSGALTASTPPADCHGVSAPVIFAQPVAITTMQIALTATDVYWDDGSAIMKQAKAGGSPEKVTDVQADGSGVIVDSNRVYWRAFAGIYGAPLQDPTAGERLATDALSLGWAVSGDAAFYFSDGSAADGTSGAGGGPGFGSAAKLVEARSTGGGPVLSIDQPSASALDLIVADSSGVYWTYNARNDPAGYGGAAGGSGTVGASSIRKLSFMTGQVSDFAPITVVDPGLLVADGSHLVWSDDEFPGPSTVWSSSLDGSQRVAIAQAPLVRGLASDGSNVYWAASSVGSDSSDILAAPLSGGPARTLACAVQDVYGLTVDDTDVYYFTYTASPIIGKIPAH